MNWQNGFQQPPAPLDQRMQSYDAAAAQTQQTVKDLAFFQRMENTQHQIALIRAQQDLEREKAEALKDAKLAEIDAQARANLALAETNNRHAYLMALTSRPQAAPVSSHSTFSWLKHPLVLMAIAAVLPLVIERLFGYRRPAPSTAQRRYNPKARKAQKFYRKRSRMARLAYQD